MDQVTTCNPMERPGKLGPGPSVVRAWLSSPRFWIGIVLCAHVLWAIWVSVSLAPWQDEISTMVTTSSGLMRAFRRGIEFEQQAPGYFVLIAALRKVFSSLLAVRLFSTACAAGTIVVSLPLIRSLAPWVPSVWVAAIMASNPYVLLSATEARLYAFAYLLSALLLLSFARAYWLSDGRARWRVLCSVCAALAIVTQFYLGFLFPVLWVALLLTRRWRGALRMALDMLPAVALMPLILGWLSRISTEVFLAGSPSWWDLALQILRDSESIALRLLDAGGARQGPLYIARQILRVVLWAACLAPLFFRKRQIPIRDLSLLPVLAMGIMVLGSMVTARMGATWDPVHATSVIVPMSLAPLVLAYGGHRLLGLAVAVLVCLSGSAECIRRDVIRHAKPCDPVGVAKAMEQHATDQDLILILPADASWALEPLYRGKAPLVPVPGPVSFEKYINFMPRSPKDIEGALERARPSADRFWLDDCNELSEEPVRDFLRQGRWLEDRRIKLRSGVELLHYVRSKE